MNINWLKSLIQKKRSVLLPNSAQPGSNNALPVWLARDLGLDDPENLKAVETGGCRKSETGYRPKGTKQPGHS
ncbi:hypothetical protein [Roseibium sp. M-1]